LKCNDKRLTLETGNLKLEFTRKGFIKGA